MSLRNMPQADVSRPPHGFSWDAPSGALERWAPMAGSESAEPADISIYDQIGEGWDGQGVTVKKIAAILRSVGGRPVTVSINSPGGDMFEGLAIYNALVAHPAEVTIKVAGYAASAASIIAMAGDRIVMGAASFLMIHNAWGVVIGNRHDFASAAELFAPFDRAMAQIYAARCGLDQATVEEMMDAETWIDAQSAVEKGFADEVADLKTAPASDKKASLRARLDASLAKAGMPRSERRALLRDYAGAPRAAGPAMQDAGFLHEARRLLTSFSS